MSQVSRPIKLNLPELFKVELDKYLLKEPPSWSYDPVYFYYLVHYLTMRQIQRKNDEYFSINPEKLKASTVWNIERYIRYLVKGEFLDRDFYIKGERPFHYKFNPRYLQGHCQVNIEPGTKLFNGMIKESRLKRSHASQESQYLKCMRKLFMNLDFDYTAARSWIDSQPDESKNSYTIPP